MKFTPEAVNFTTASFALGPGTGNSTSSITSGPPVCLTCMAFMDSGFYTQREDSDEVAGSGTKTLSFRSRRRGICCCFQCNAAGKKQIPQRLTPSRNDKANSRLGMTKLPADFQDEGDRATATLHFFFSSAVQF